MQVEIRTTAISPLRQSFANIERRIGSGKTASRYQEATLDLQSEVNFHYLPLWDRHHQLYDRQRTAVVMNDWYAFKDPRQFYYGSYVAARARQQETAERQLEFVARKQLLSELDAAERARLVFALLPLRHVEWAANANNCQITAYAWGNAVAQTTMFHTMDRLGLAQYLSRIGLLLDGNSGDALLQARSAWLEHADWQPLRRLVENQMVMSDWFELFIAQNLVLDGLIYPLVYQRFDAKLAARSGPGLSLCLEFFAHWYDETQRWVDATVKTAASESAANASVLSASYRSARDACSDALRPWLEHLFGADADAELTAALSALNQRADRIGLRSTLEGHTP